MTGEMYLTQQNGNMYALVADGPRERSGAPVPERVDQVAQLLLQLQSQSQGGQLSRNAQPMVLNLGTGGALGGAAGGMQLAPGPSQREQRELNTLLLLQALQAQGRLQPQPQPALSPAAPLANGPSPSAAPSRQQQDMRDTDSLSNRLGVAIVQTTGTCDGT